MQRQISAAKRSLAAAASQRRAEEQVSTLESQASAAEERAVSLSKLPGVRRRRPVGFRVIATHTISDYAETSQCS